MAESLRTSDSQQQLVGARHNSGKLLPTPVTVTGVSFVSTMWLTATFLLFAGLVVAAGFPNWLHNEVPPGSGQARDLRTQISQVDLGLFFLYYNYTGNPCLGSFIYGACNSTCRGVWCDAQLYLAYDPPATLVQGGANVSTGLQAPDIRDIAFLFSSSIVYAFGCGMLLVSLFMGVVAYCKPRIKSCPMFLVAFVFQVISGEHGSRDNGLYCTCSVCAVLYELLTSWHVLYLHIPFAAYALVISLLHVHSPPYTCTLSPTLPPPPSPSTHTHTHRYLSNCCTGAVTNQLWI